MAIIEVRNLTKRFDVALSRPGVGGMLRGLLSPEYRSVTAVDGVSLTVEEGETVAFIGPNGAGKSTTIKMLTGLLHPTSGTATVGGLVPWDERERLAFTIGCVFGQRSQLWYHLPPADSFRVLGRIFDLDDDETTRRTARLAELFDLNEFMTTPVRKLSLGQRMRCEVAACLLHRPRMIFLDEPTIGLDVVAKRTIRELIGRLNQEEQTTIFLTSHDAGDIERLCRRVVVVNRGGVVLDLPVKELKHRYLAVKDVGVRFEVEPETLPERPGLELTKRKGAGMRFRVDTSRCPIGEALAAVAAAGSVEDITVADLPLEDVIARIYESGAGEVGA